METMLAVAQIITSLGTIVAIITLIHQIAGKK